MRNREIPGDGTEGRREKARWVGMAPPAGRRSNRATAPGGGGRRRGQAAAGGDGGRGVSGGWDQWGLIPSTKQKNCRMTYVAIN